MTKLHMCELWITISLHKGQPMSVQSWHAQILVIAVLMKAVMQRTFNVFQWEALVLLVAGITVNQLNYCTCAPGRPAGASRVI